MIVAGKHGLVSCVPVFRAGPVVVGTVGRIECVGLVPENDVDMWYIVYKRKMNAERLEDNLRSEKLNYCIPKGYVERLNEEGTEMEEVEEVAIRNLVFLQTDRSLQEVINAVDGLSAPFLDTMTGRPAEVSDEEMERFIRILKVHPADIKLLSAPYARFSDRPKVRVRAGLFEGMEGRVVRIRRDRKLVVAVGRMAIAVSGIHRSLLEIVNE